MPTRPNGHRCCHPYLRRRGIRAAAYRSCDGATGPLNSAGAESIVPEVGGAMYPMRCRSSALKEQLWRGLAATAGPAGLRTGGAAGWSTVSRLADCAVWLPYEPDRVGIGTRAM